MQADPIAVRGPTVVPPAMAAFVPLVLAALYLAFVASPDWRRAAVALPLCASGVALLIWARVSLRLHPPTVLYSGSRAAQLVVQGPYRFVRYPGGTAAILIAAAGILATFNVWSVLLALWTVMLCVIGALGEERARDRGVFADAYRDYRRRTGMLFPRLPVEIGYGSRPLTW